MNVIDLKEKEVFKKEDRGFANLVDEKYLQINQVCLEPGQQVPQHNANSNVTLTVVRGEGAFHVGNERGRRTDPPCHRYASPCAHTLPQY